METKDTIHARVRARDAAMRLLNRLTTGAAVSALVGVAALGAISAHTIPGITTSSSTTSTTSSSSSSSTSTTSGLQTSTTPVSSSSSSGVAVSGGSR